MKPPEFKKFLSASQVKTLRRFPFRKIIEVQQWYMEDLDRFDNCQVLFENDYMPGIGGESSPMQMYVALFK